MLIGRHAFAKDAKPRIAVAFLDVPQDLIVGAVFLDQINDMFEDRRFADAFGHGAWWLTGPGRQKHILFHGATIVAKHGQGLQFQLRFVRQGNERKRAEVLM